jgi:hypothetical protein
LRLNHGLFMANQNKWDEAALMLSPIATTMIGNGEGEDGASKDGKEQDVTVSNARKLYQMCLVESSSKTAVNAS